MGDKSYIFGTCCMSSPLEMICFLFIIILMIIISCWVTNPLLHSGDVNYLTKIRSCFISNNKQTKLTSKSRGYLDFRHFAFR
jgi:cytochrome b subunit of formate dehydrogenase